MIDASLSSETLARTEIDELAGVLLARGGVAALEFIAAEGLGSRSGDGDSVCVGDASVSSSSCAATARRNGAGIAPEPRGPLTGVTTTSGIAPERIGVFDDLVGDDFFAAMNSRTYRWMTLAATSLTNDLNPPGVMLGDAPPSGAGASSGHTDCARGGVAGLDFGLDFWSAALARAMRSSVRLFSAIISRTFVSDVSRLDLYPRNQVWMRRAASSSDSSSSSTPWKTTGSMVADASSSESVRSSPRDAASSAASALDTIGDPLRLRLALFPLCVCEVGNGGCGQRGVTRAERRG